MGEMTDSDSKVTGKDELEAADSGSVDPAKLRKYVQKLQHLMMIYEFGMEEVMTKVNILRNEFLRTHSYNPIEHVGFRVKTPQSLIRKAKKKNIALNVPVLREQIHDIAGVRLSCSFVSDIYRMRQLLLNQSDIRLIREQDYIKNPKPNGYRSLHLVIEVPVYLAEGVEQVPVEIQLRTVAMDFWASLEHKIHYKYDKRVPEHLTHALKLAADMATTLDTSMERIHQEIVELEACEKSEGIGQETDESGGIFALLADSFPDLFKNTENEKSESVTQQKDK